GPPEEVRVVRSIYRMFIHDGKREREIAQGLQEAGVATETGTPWTGAMVHQILTNEKYIGHNVYNRVSFKLKKKRVRNDPEMWVRAEGAFPEVVDPESFYMARGIIQERHRVFTDEEMVRILTRLYAAN